MKGSIQKEGNVRYVVFRVPGPETGKKKQKRMPAGSNKKEADKKLTEIMGEVHERIKTLKRRRSRNSPKYGLHKWL